MKQKYLILLAIIFSLFASSLSANEEANKKALNALADQNSLGRLFYVVIPPNDSPNISADALEIFVASSVDTKVTLSNENTGLLLTKQVKAYKVTRFSSRDGDFGNDVEIFDSSRPLPAGLKVESPDPISVYVMNAKPVTTDGYMAIPVSAWGTKYIHLSFWDFKEVYEWKTGFIVMASENGTKVNIQLKGKGLGFAKTDRGLNIGQSIVITLKKGEVYMVRGDGKTRGAFDLSGTEITANKKIGLISFHTRCMIPVTTVDNGRDHISEMMPPVQAWGKKYVSVELKRKDYGDYFRVICAEDNTTFKYKSYDFDSKNIIEQGEITLDLAGDFAEVKDIQATYPHPDALGIRGTTTWEADKPIFVMHYAYSQNWDDGGTVYDPFMMNVTAQEQYTKNTIFQTPQNFSANEFRVNYLNLIAIGDTTSQTKNKALLETIKIDDIKVSTFDSKFSLNRVPFTDLFYTRIAITPGPHKIQGDTPFGGYIYGFSNANSYGWPAASAYRKLGEFDTLPPVCLPTGECGSYSVPTTELRDGTDGDNPMQKDVGVDQTPVLSIGSYNFEDPTVDDALYPLNPARRELFIFKTKVKDKTQDGVALIRVTDAVGNDTLITLRYEADSIIVNPNPIEFKNQRLKKTSAKLDVEIKSNSDSIIFIKSIKLQKNDVFAISDPLLPDGTGFIVLQPHQAKTIKMTYTPKVEYIDIPIKMDLDSLVIETKCLTHTIPVIGKGVIPRIIVEDYNAGTILVNDQVCKQGGFFILNEGTDTLTVTGIDKTTTDVVPFTWDKIGAANFFPFKVAPKETIHLETLCVQSAAEGKFKFNVKFLTDIDVLTATDDDISIWEVDVRKPGPSISSEFWDLSRIQSVNTTNGMKGKGFVFLRNAGSAPIIFTGIELADKNDPNFKILPNQFDKGLPITIFPANATVGDTILAIPVQYNPQSIGKHSVAIRALVDKTVDPSGYVSGILEGTGFLPQVSVSSYTFTPSCLVNTTHQTAGANTVGVVKIKNESTIIKVPLNVYSIQKDVTGNPADFIEVLNGQAWNTYNVNNPLVIPVDGEVELRMNFAPTVDGLRNMKFNILTDAAAQKPDNTAPKDILNQDGQVWGTGYLRGISLTNINFGNVLSCDNPIDSIKITNTSATEDLNLSNLRLVFGDANSFNLVNSLPNKLPAGQTVYLKYQLSSTAALGTLKNTYSFDAENLPSPIFTVEANLYKVKVQLKLDKFPLQNPGKPFNFPVSISEIASPPSTNVLKDAKITEFSVVIRSKKDALYVMKNGAVLQYTLGNALTGNWIVDVKQYNLPNDNLYSYIKIDGAAQDANSSISTAGNLVVLNTLNMLSESSTYKPEIFVVTLGDKNSRSICVDTVLVPGEITSSLCAQPIRAITTSLYQYELHSINPNPISTNNFELKFDVAVDCHTKIEILNSAGMVIDIPVNQVMKAGQFAVDVNTTSLSSGIYYIKMKAGFYEETQKLVISK